MPAVVTHGGEYTFAWPPVNGKRRFPMDRTVLCESSPAALSESRRRAFPEPTGDDVAARRPAAERRLIYEAALGSFRAEDATTEQRRPPDTEPPFAFLRPGLWKPTGAREALIPAPPPRPAPKEGEAAAPAKVSEVNPRLLKPLHRKEWKEPERETKTVDTARLVKKLMDDDVRQRKLRHEALLAKSTTRDAHPGRSPPPPLRPDDVPTFVQRHAVAPQARKEAKHEALMKRHAPEPPKRRLEPAQQRASTARLYGDGRRREQEAMERACKKYIDDRTPQASPRSESQWAETAQRLHSRNK